MEETLRVIEIFTSIQGETSHAGLPCTFVRLAGCNLHCAYCDTRYAVTEAGTEMLLGEAVRQAHKPGRRLVCITGGEPLLQAGAASLARQLIALNHTVLVETNGTLDIRVLPPEAARIMDVKCPGSGEAGKTLQRNLSALRPGDEVKFVLCDRRDFEWAQEFVAHAGLAGRCHLLFAPAHPVLAARELAGWILNSGLDVRLEIQLHKVLWPEKQRGA